MKRTMSGTKSARGRVTVGLLASLALCLVGLGAGAQTFADRASDLTSRHNLIKAAEADVAAARERARIVLGGWFPNLNLTGFYGHENQV